MPFPCVLWSCRLRALPAELSCRIGVCVGCAELIYNLSKPPQTTETDEGPLAVTQYHFTSWPDHGVPQFTTSLVSFVRRVQKAHNKDVGVPLLVHCSAGVGQTGTFILLDSMLEKMREENSLNVYECLVNLRKRRVLMVQTLVLLHKMHFLLTLSC